jgi:hypothetical protein
MTPAEKARLQATADLAGLSLSEVIRRCCFGREIVAQTDVAVIGELRRIGGLLKHVHNESGGAYSAATASAINDIRAVITALSARKNDCQKNPQSV